MVAITAVTVVLLLCGTPMNNKKQGNTTGSQADANRTNMISRSCHSVECGQYQVRTQPVSAFLLLTRLPGGWWVSCPTWVQPELGNEKNPDRAGTEAGWYEYKKISAFARSRSESVKIETSNPPPTKYQDIAARPSTGTTSGESRRRNTKPSPRDNEGYDMHTP